MKRYISIIIVLLTMSVLSPMNRLAAASDSDRNADQLGDIGRELSHASISHRNFLQEKHIRQSHHHERKRTLAKLQQSDLLLELLASETVHHESTQGSDGVKKLHE